MVEYRKRDHDVVDQAFLAWLTGPYANPACRGKDPDLFFPPPGLQAARKVRKAKAICAGCEHLVACRDWALRQSSYLYGVWAGTTHEERNRKPR